MWRATRDKLRARVARLDSEARARAPAVDDQYRLLRRLPDRQLRALLGAADAEPRDRARSPCVAAPPAQARAAARLLRWPDLEPSEELRPLPPPACSEPHCCNPYHRSRLCIRETPPPPYRRTEPPPEPDEYDDAAAAAAVAAAERLHSQTTDGEGGPGGTWCRLAYWEMAVRVGRMYPVDEPAVNVFGDSPKDQGLCLDALQRNGSAPESVARTRAKIGLGLTLSREADGVWAYNRSEQPIFVHSPALDDADTRTLLVYRVPPGHCLRVFDPSERPPLRPRPRGSAPAGPVDLDSVRISFAKGWGPKYSRRDVTACPCWLEVMLAPCR